MTMQGAYLQRAFTIFFEAITETIVITPFLWYTQYMNQHDKSCVMKTLKIIGSKWTILLLRELFDGTKRFGELQKSLEGISPKTLSLRLKQLEKDRIIRKKVFAEIPLHVEYSLTSRGDSLSDIIAKIKDWGDSKE
jgi:DNA-binding HxlR family transcriptional regulator